MTATELPDRDEVDDTIKLVNDHAQRIFLWRYERERPQLVTLYNKAMSSQWSSVTELDWDTEVDPEVHVDFDAPMMRLASEARYVPRLADQVVDGQGAHRASASSRSRPRSVSSCTASRAP